MYNHRQKIKNIFGNFREHSKIQSSFYYFQTSKNYTFPERI